MMRSGTIRRPRKIAVVVANEPMPSASKKLVPKPTPICSGEGKRASVAGLASAFPPAVRRACATAHAQSPAKAIDKAPSAARRAEIGFIG